MTMPTVYEPEEGYKYQILTRCGHTAWEHCDYAKDRTERNYLLREYRLAYGAGFTFKSILLPSKFWPKGDK